jgi:hypothetical protein
VKVRLYPSMTKEPLAVAPAMLVSQGFGGSGGGDGDGDGAGEGLGSGAGEGDGLDGCGLGSGGGGDGTGLEGCGLGSGGGEGTGGAGCGPVFGCMRDKSVSCEDRPAAKYRAFQQIPTLLTITYRYVGFNDAGTPCP